MSGLPPKGASVIEIMRPPVKGVVSDYVIDKQTGEVGIEITWPVLNPDGSEAMVEDQHYDVVQATNDDGSLKFTTDEGGRQVPVWTDQKINVKTEMIVATNSVILPASKVQLNVPAA